MERTTKQTIIVGFNNTGKSTVSKKILSAYTAIPNRKGLIITPDPVEWLDVDETTLEKPSDFVFDGLRKYVWNEEEKENVKAMKRAKHYYFDGFLIFDDCRSYLDSQTPPWLKYFYIRRRQKMIDLMMVAHGVTDIPPRAFTNCTDMFMFLTKDDISMRKKDLGSRYFELIEHQRRVNAKALDTSKAWTSSGKIEDNIHYCEHIKF